MQSARVAVYRFKPGTADEVIRKAEAGLLPLYRKQPGFVSYSVVKTSNDAGISISMWESHMQAEAAVTTAATWVKDNIASMVESVQNHVGDLSFSSSATPVGR